MSLLGIDERTLSSFLATPSAPSLTFLSVGPEPNIYHCPLRGESGRMADWTSNTETVTEGEEERRGG